MVPDDVRASQLRTLENFVLRARRIQAHSLVQDLQQVVVYASEKISATVNMETGVAELRMSLPPEEIVESLAARVRPLLLTGDPVEFSKVIKAYKSLGAQANHQPTGEAAEVLARNRAKYFPPDDEMVAYSLVRNVDDPATKLTDTAAALSWIYGDVVHADPDRRATGDAIGLAERYRAAVPYVFRAVMLTISTLNAIKMSSDAEVFELPSDVWTGSVVHDGSDYVVEGALHVAPVGTPVPDGPLGEDWKSAGEGPHVFLRGRGRPVPSAIPAFATWWWTPARATAGLGGPAGAGPPVRPISE